MQLNDSARVVLEKRYLVLREDGTYEPPETMLKRVAQNAAEAELQYEASSVEEAFASFFQIMDSREFLPNSPTLMNAGRELQQLSACFVLPIDDSMEAIFEALKQTALIQKSGGGTGFSFSRLRPQNDRVKTTGGVASGPISFLKCFNAATEAIKQGGTRRGANMGILRVDHPDILEFIQCKADNKDITNFNISVGLTKAFMDALRQDASYSLVNPRTQQKVETLKARDVFELIVKMSWQNGEPGIVFLDRMEEANPTPHIGTIEATNPCGEQPLLPYESCNLGSINLLAMAACNNEGRWAVDWEHLRSVVHKAVHFLDNVIDVNRYPIPEIAEVTKGNRKIGLGVMGFADLLFRLGIPYASEQAIETARQIMGFIRSESRAASAKLAEQRGVFPNFPGSVWDQENLQLRHATVTTIAPTGTISIIAGCSSGIEPVFGLAFSRNVLDGEKLLDVNPVLEQVLRERGLYTEALMEQVAQTGTLASVDGLDDALKQLFVTAHDVAPEWHIRMQAAFQEYTDNAVSKTVNFPALAEREDIERVYDLADKLGCKGVTVYRSGSREGEVLTSGTTAAGDAPAAALGKHTPRKRPDITQGETERIRTGCGTLYVTLNIDEEGLCEVFSTIGKAGGCAAAFSEATARLASLALRSGVEPSQIQRQIAGIRCPSPNWRQGEPILSCPDAIAKVLARYLGGSPENQRSEEHQGAVVPGCCPECGGVLCYESGCSVCRECGFSRCS